MTIPRNRLLKALRQPRHAIDYVFRIWKLSKFLPECNKYEIQKFFKEASEVREKLETRLKTHGDPDSSARLLAPSVIYTVVRALKPETTIETGVENGISTYFILSALERNGYGMLHSIEIRETLDSNIFKEGKKTGWVVPEELRHRWNFLLGDSKEILPRILSELKSVDIFMHDSEHTYEHMNFEFRTAWRYLHDGGVLLSDDIYLNKAFEDFIRLASPSRIATFALLGALRK